VGILLAVDPVFLEHDSGPGHPERPARLEAVERGITEAGLDDAVERVQAVPASRTSVERVHKAEYLDAVERFCEHGGGYLDGDTHVGPRSYEAALLAAGAGLTVADRLAAGEGDVGLCAVRPPGHHATIARAMGFCLINHVAVTAAELAARGERVVIVDYDAHHGNGTQDIFYEHPDVLYVSMHEWPMYPGTGRLDEVGEGAGHGTTLNLPFPAGTTGDVYRRAVDDVVAPRIASFAPTRLLISAGYDGHRRDPLTDLGLAAGDFADLTVALAQLVPDARPLLFLEGGYDLTALAVSVGASLSALVDDGAYRPESSTTGGPGRQVCRDAEVVQAALF
jgi:acetoin utilization deacetylase AcuC-like enzyme